MYNHENKETWEQREAREKLEIEAAGAKVDALLKLFKGFHLEKESENASRFEVRRTIVKGDERILFVSGNYGNKGRIQVMALYPRGPKHEYIKPQHNVDVTVSVSRDAESLFKDIERRFLPAYRVELAYVLNVIAQYKAYDEKTNGALAEALGRKPTPQETESKSAHGYLGDEGGSTRWELKASDNDVDMRLDNISPSIARRIIRLVEGSK
jgi:hypothetical protein